jgi:hypothetical protein
MDALEMNSARVPKHLLFVSLQFSNLYRYFYKLRFTSAGIGSSECRDTPEHPKLQKCGIYIYTAAESSPPKTLNPGTQLSFAFSRLHHHQRVLRSSRSWRGAYPSPASGPSPYSGSINPQEQVLVSHLPPSQCAATTAYSR